MIEVYYNNYVCTKRLELSNRAKKVMKEQDLPSAMERKRTIESK